MQFTDQLQRTIQLPEAPVRIVSLVPSQTELLFDLELSDDVVGITQFCIHPDEWYRKKTRVGGTKQLKMEVIESLQPDLIIANKEENDKVQLELLMERWPVWVSDIKNLPAALSMIDSVGNITGKVSRAAELCDKITTEFEKLSFSIENEKAKSALYLIWNDPMMCAGSDTFINDMMQHCGLHNVLSNELRYPVLTIEKLKALHPEYILLSSEPFPFKEKHREQFQLLFPDTKVILADGEYFSWYGSRLALAPSYFKSFLLTIKS